MMAVGHLHKVVMPSQTPHLNKTDRYDTSAPQQDQLLGQPPPPTLINKIDL